MRLCLSLLAIVGALALPAAASALAVTVTVHGAGGVTEIPNSLDETRNQGPCEVDPAGATPATVTVCELGDADGFWNVGDVVRLTPLANPDIDAYNAGWRFDKWVDGSGPGEVNCSPEESTGDHTNPVYCEFEITEDATIDLYFKDVGGPNTVFHVTGAAEFTNDATVTYEFTSPTDPDATFECKLEGPSGAGTYYDCGGPDDKSEDLVALADGAYTFSVRGTDINGNVESTPATSTWLLDTVKPTVSVTFPWEWLYLSANHFTPVYSVSDANLSPASKVCFFDFDNVPCDEELTGVSEGPHRFGVRVWDCCANRGVQSHYFIVDTVNPNTKITSGPSGDNRSRTVTFKFQETTAEYGNVYFKCRLDAGDWKSCKSPKTYTVARGRHTFRVKGVDDAGNEELTPAVRTWRRT
jgi:hypothetical protein